MINEKSMFHFQLFTCERNGLLSTRNWEKSPKLRNGNDHHKPIEQSMDIAEVAKLKFNIESMNVMFDTN